MTFKKIDEYIVDHQKKEKEKQERIEQIGKSFRELTDLLNKNNHFENGKTIAKHLGLK